MPAGRGTRSPASTMTNSAWLARLSVNPITSSPTASAAASDVYKRQTPARSLPWPEGNVDGHRSARAPARIFASPGLIPAALTLTRTCPRPGTGRSTSATRSTSVPPYWSYLTALGIAEPPSQVLCVGEEPRPALVYARDHGSFAAGPEDQGPCALCPGWARLSLTSASARCSCSWKPPARACWPAVTAALQPPRRCPPGN